MQSYIIGISRKRFYRPQRLDFAGKSYIIVKNNYDWHRNSYIISTKQACRSAKEFCAARRNGSQVFGGLHPPKRAGFFYPRRGKGEKTLNYNYLGRNYRKALRARGLTSIEGWDMHKEGIIVYFYNDKKKSTEKAMICISEAEAEAMEYVRWKEIKNMDK